MREYVIVPMEPAHVAQVADLEKQCFSLPWSENSIAGELQNPNSFWLVATDGEKVLGYIGSQCSIDEADMMNVAVLPEARRNRVGERLVLALVDGLKARGMLALTLEVRASNEAAQAMYARLDFQQVGRRKNYYYDPREDALILRKEWRV